jgi:hypothetical protein
MYGIKKKNNPDMGCIESNKQILEIWMYGIGKKTLEIECMNGNLNPTFECMVLENSTIEQWMYGIGKK